MRTVILNKRATIIALSALSFLVMSNWPATFAASAHATRQRTSVQLHDRPLIRPPGESDLVESALLAVKEGDRLKLARIYKLSLLTGQQSGSDEIHSAMCESLRVSHETAKIFYRDGNVGEALERIRLFFNLANQLSGVSYSQSSNEVEEWLIAAKVLGLPKEQCIGALNDYGLFLNCAGQYSLAIPVLKAVIREAPDRAIAYLNLADAEWSSGNHAATASNNHKYKLALAQRKYNAQAPATGANSPSLEASSNNGRLEDPGANDGTLKRDVIALLSTKGQLIEPSTTRKFSFDATSNQSSSSTNAIQSDLDLPWLVDIYHKGQEQNALRALTDDTSHPRHQLNRRTVSQSSLLRCIELNDNAILALQDRQPQDAITSLTEALNIDPGCVLTLGNLAVAFNNMAVDKSDHPKLALKAMHQALALAPNSHSMRENMNAILLKLGKNPSSVQTRQCLGRELLEQGDYLGALVEYREAFRIQGDPSVKDMIAAITAQIASDELLPPTPTLSKGNGAIKNTDSIVPIQTSAISGPSSHTLAGNIVGTRHP